MFILYEQIVEDQFYKGYKIKFAAAILHKSDDMLVY